MRKKIVVTGSLAFDIIMNFPGKFSDHILPDKIHTLNLSFLVDKMVKTQGGTAGNIAYSLGLLEMSPVLLSVFGKDGEEYRDFLKKYGVDVSLSLISQKLFSSQSFTMTDQEDNQITSFYPGAMEENNSLEIPGLAAEDLFFVISPNTPLAMKNFCRECAAAKIPYLYDPGMQLPRIDPQDLKFGIENCEVLIGNDYEIELMKKMIGTFAPPIVVTTLGEKGAVIFDHRGKESKQDIISTVIPKEVIDPTGAGDAFRAGFLAGFVKGKSLEVCGQMGAVCAAYTVERYGTTTHFFTSEEFDRRYRENFGEEKISFVK